MSQLFITILNNALVAGWIILAVIALRLMFKKIPKWINCLMWGLVAIKLVIPFRMESIFSLIPSAKPVPADIEYAKVPQIDSGISAVNTVINPVLEKNFTATEMSSVNPMQVVASIASYIWILGVFALLIYAFVSFIMLNRQVKDALPVDGRIYKCNTIEGPFILGILKPSIYIPDSLEEIAFSCVIEHEKAHIKRGDFIWKPLGFLILSIYWFNPLCWIAYSMLCKDIEYACDEKVTKDKDKDWKTKYCQVLLDCSTQRRLISACPVAFGEASVKDRVKSVIKYKKPAFWIVCASVITCVVVGICFLTNPKEGDFKLLDYVSPSTSAMAFFYFDGEKTEVKWLYDETYERKIMDEINRLATKKCDNERISEMTVPSYGIEISDREGYDIWLTYSNGFWLNKDGSVYEAEYNFEKLYTEIPSVNPDKLNSGFAMPNAGLLGEADKRYYSPASDISSEKNGISLSIGRIEGVKVTVFLQNNSEEDFVYGTYYSLQKEIDGVWYILPPKLSNYAFLDIARVLHPGENSEEECDLTMYCELSDGHYRVEKEGMATEFLVKNNKCADMEKESTLPDGFADLRYSEYTYDFLFNFGGKFYLSDDYIEPEHGDGTPIGWYALGGEGKCIDPAYAERETFVEGKLIGYTWLDNHSENWKIMPFSVGEYSCCLYRYFFDLCTASELEQYPNAETMSEYWVVFYTEGEGKPLYLKYFNSDYFTQEQAMENIVPGAAILYGSYIDEENLGVIYQENPSTHTYTVDGDMVFKYKKSLIGKDPKALHSVQYIVLTNEEDITWEKVQKSLYSSNSEDWLTGTIIIGMNTLE